MAPAAGLLDHVRERLEVVHVGVLLLVLAGGRPVDVDPTLALLLDGGDDPAVDLVARHRAGRERRELLAASVGARLHRRRTEVDGDEHLVYRVEVVAVGGDRPAQRLGVAPRLDLPDGGALDHRLEVLDARLVVDGGHRVDDRAVFGHVVGVHDRLEEALGVRDAVVVLGESGSEHEAHPVRVLDRGLLAEQHLLLAGDGVLVGRQTGQHRVALAAAPPVGDVEHRSGAAQFHADRCRFVRFVDVRGFVVAHWSLAHEAIRTMETRLIRWSAGVNGRSRRGASNPSSRRRSAATASSPTQSSSP
ncbi:hypothetical protein BN903_194 [Halorubrum sp. AJ67]|nr:hypothetical protein BN903_194 [Halorubrum sp. AJ67]